MSAPRNTDSIESRLDAIIPESEAMQIPSAAAEQAITDRLLGSLEPVRPLPSRTVLAAAFLGIFAIVTAVLVAFVGTRGAAGMTAPQLLGVLAAIIVAASLAASSLSRDISPGQRRFAHPGIVYGGVLVALFALLAGLFPWVGGPTEGWHCFGSGFVFSLPAVGLVLLVVNRGAPLAWGAVGASAGLLGGLVGMAAIHVGCSMLNSPHMMTGHLTIPLAGAIGGYLTGKALPYLMPSRSGNPDF